MAQYEPAGNHEHFAKGVKRGQIKKTPKKRVEISPDVQNKKNLIFQSKYKAGKGHF